MKSPHLLIVLAVLNVPVYVLVLRKFFDDWGEVEAGLWAWNAPFWASLRDAVSGRWLDNQWAKTKLLVACVLCGLLVLLEYGTVKDHAPAIVRWLDQAW
jgi:hypothetical protein